MLCDSRLKSLLFYLAAAIICMHTLRSSVKAQTELRIGIIGDQTSVDEADVTSNLAESYKKLDNAVALLRARHVQIILHTGDLIEDSIAMTELAYDNIFDKAAAIIDGSGLPWFLTPGDHDVNPPKDYTFGSPDNTYRQYFQRVYGKRQAAAKDHLYYSFNFRGFHFIALDSLEHLRTDPRWGDVFLSEISDEQFEWLKKDLSAHRQASAITVFTHQPLWYNWAGWSRVHSLLQEFHVKAVIAGHFHYNQDEGVLDGIRYLVVGATGADVKQGSKTSGNIHHVTIMTLAKRSPARFALLPLTAEQAAAFQPRSDMDKVQALDVMLDNNYYKNYDQFGPSNPLCLIDGTVYSDSAKSPAQLHLLPIGNPIDQVVSVSLENMSNAWILEGPGFRIDAKACTQESSANTCFLLPGAGIIASNNSSVILPDKGTPMWQTQLKSKSTPVQPDMPVVLRMRVSFHGQQGEYMLERKLQTRVSTNCK